MPLYEYQCLPERHTFEVRHGFNENPVSTCAVCGGPVRRVIHPVGIVFKGSGFYVNDSRKSGSTAQPASNGKAADASSESSKGTSESAGEAKADSSAKTPPASKGEAAAAG